MTRPDVVLPDDMDVPISRTTGMVRGVGSCRAQNWAMVTLSPRTT